MARHSKWHKVRQFKGAIDAKRAASFTKISREITVATREKGADPHTNARLRVAMIKAREASMPKDNIERAIQRGLGVGTEGKIETLTYEAYGSGGVALIMECVTDNRNRTANDVKYVLSKHDGTLANAGAVTYLFDHVGSVSVFRDTPFDDAQELLLIDMGAVSIESDGTTTDVLCAPANINAMADSVARMGCTLSRIGLVWVPKSRVDVVQQVGESVEALMEALEALDDVSAVYSNLL